MVPKILIYTFRTFPFITTLEEEFDKLDITILHKLKNDLDLLSKEIVATKPDIIIGLAKSHSDKSFFEPVTINKFNKSNKVINGSEDLYKLFIPDLIPKNFAISPNPSSTFCNYSMYKISHFLNENNINVKFSFIHISEEGIKQIKEAFEVINYV